mgnify:CR=1 FL=1
MKNNYIKIIAGFLILALSLHMRAQVYEIPFEYDYTGKSIYVSVNGNKPVRFKFDTGSEITALNYAYARKIGLKGDSIVEVIGVTGVQKYPTSKNNVLHLSKECALQNITLTQLSLSDDTNENMMQGIIGADILKRYVVSIDYDKKIIQFIPFGKAFNSQGFEEMTFEHSGDYFPRVNVKIALPDGTEVSGLSFLDTGGEFGYLMSAPYAKEKDVMKKVGKYLQRESYSVNGKGYNYITRVKSFELGGLKTGNFAMDISQSKTGVINMPGYMGMIGFELLKNFNTIIDSKNGKIYFKPNRNFNQPAWFPLNGFIFSENEGKCFISYMLDEKDANFEVGDQVLEINGMPFSSIEKFDDILMNSQAGQEHTIKIKNKKGETKTEKLIIHTIL